MTRAAILAETLYDGLIEAAQPNRLVRVEGGRIVSVAPPPPVLPEGTRRAAVLAPGFIDWQINGAADRLFNDAPQVETLARIARGARQGGTAHLLPTFITAPGRAFEKALAAVREAMEEGVPGLLGVHLEGPFLSPERPGIHPRAAIRPMDEEDCRIIEAAAPLLRLVTLAPERQEPALMQRLAASGALLFAGHSEAGAEAMRAAPLTGVTHLFNAMPPLAGRAPGVVGAALTDERLHAGIIADGLHIDPVNLALAARVMADRLSLVTDAMPTLAGTRDGFTLMGTEITLRGNRLAGPDGTLAGAHLSMDEAVRNMVRLAGVAPGRALMMASRNPARALGLEGELGAIRPGHRASLTLLDADLRAEGVMVDGAWAEE